MVRVRVGGGLLGYGLRSAQPKAYYDQNLDPPFKKQTFTFCSADWNLMAAKLPAVRKIDAFCLTIV